MQKKKDQSPQKPSSFDLSTFGFLWDYILIKALREESTGLIIKPEQYEDNPEFGVVLSVGNGKLLDDGTVGPMFVKPGDKVFFGKYSTVKTRSVGKDFFIVRSEDIMAVAK